MPCSDSLPTFLANASRFHARLPLPLERSKFSTSVRLPRDPDGAGAGLRFPRHFREGLLVVPAPQLVLHRLSLPCHRVGILGRRLRLGRLEGDRDHRIRRLVDGSLPVELDLDFHRSRDGQGYLRRFGDRQLAMLACQADGGRGQRGDRHTELQAERDPASARLRSFRRRRRAAASLSPRRACRVPSCRPRRSPCRGPSLPSRGARGPSSGRPPTAVRAPPACVRARRSPPPATRSPNLTEGVLGPAGLLPASLVTTTARSLPET